MRNNGNQTSLQMVKENTRLLNRIENFEKKRIKLEVDLRKCNDELRVLYRKYSKNTLPYSEKYIESASEVVK